MTAVALIVGTCALLGSALIGGVFFAFSSFVMGALGRRPAAEGIAAMQEINRVVLNASFLGVFMATAILSVLVAALALWQWQGVAAGFGLAGAALYLVGTFLVTGFGNVPLNDKLAALDSSAADAVRHWQAYLQRWTLLNTVRSAAAMVAALLFAVGLILSSR